MAPLLLLISVFSTPAFSKNINLIEEALCYQTNIQLSLMGVQSPVQLHTFETYSPNSLIDLKPTQELHLLITNKCTCLIVFS